MSRQNNPKHGFLKGHKQSNTGRTHFKKGYIVSEETRKKMSERMKGDKNPAKRLEVRKKMSEIRKGKTLEELYGTGKALEAKRKMSESRKGKKASKKTIDKMKSNHYDNSGENHYNYGKRGKDSSNWQGGLTPINKIIRNGTEFRLWREAVFARDDWTCQKCKEQGYRLHPHHIRNFAQYLELRFDIDNGITFCRKCHIEFHKIYGRKNNNQEQINKFLDNKQK